MNDRGPIKGALFDIGGVVIKTPFEMLDYHAQSRPLPVDWRGPFDPATDPAFVEVTNGELSERDYWAMRAEEMRRFFPGASAADAMRSLFTVPEAVVLRRQVVDLIEAIHKTKIQVGLLTNDLGKFHGEHWRQDLPTIAGLGVLVDLSFTNTLKPHPDAYVLGAEALGLEPTDILFVDDQAVNIAGAERCGLHAIQFDVVAPATSVAEIATRLELPYGNPP